MVNRTVAALVAVTFLSLQGLPSAALAENQMGYQLLSQQQAAGLPRNGGALGMDIGRAQQINEGGMTFDLLRVNGVRRGSPGAQAGFNVGDQIIAVDGQVFQNVAAFAAYVGSLQPGRQIAVDYMPANGGPQQAQRVAGHGRRRRTRRPRPGRGASPYRHVHRQQARDWGRRGGVVRLLQARLLQPLRITARQRRRERQSVPLNTLRPRRTFGNAPQPPLLFAEQAGGA